MKARLSCLVLLLAAALPANAQSVVSEPIGFNKVTCLAGSDTIVGVPFRKEGSRTATLTADPETDGDAATLTLSISTTGPLPVHYLKFTSGPKNGAWFDITANTENSVTINLNGDNLDPVSAGDGVLIAEYWTLNTLFPPDKATTDPTTTGHAIVASVNQTPWGKKNRGPASGRVLQRHQPRAHGIVFHPWRNLETNRQGQ